MTRIERLLLISAIDNVLIEELGYYELFTAEERTEITNEVLECIEDKTLKEFRDRIVDTAQKLYAELKEGESCSR